MNKYYHYIGDEPSPSAKYLWPHIFGFIRQNKSVRVLDFGCGNGALVEFLRNDGVCAHGIDPSPHFSVKFEKSEFLYNIDVEMLREQVEGQFDVIIALEVFAFVDNPTSELMKLKKLLKPGGVLIASGPYHGYWKNLLISILNGWDRHLNPNWYGTQVHFYSVKTFSSFLAESGLKVFKMKRVGRIPILAKSMIFFAEM